MLVVVEACKVDEVDKAGKVDEVVLDEGVSQGQAW